MDAGATTHRLDRVPGLTTRLSVGPAEAAALFARKAAGNLVRPQGFAEW
jgi:hypothetical protein